MPPKKADKKSISSSDADNEEAAETINMTALEDLLDRRLRYQSNQINDLFLKYSKLSKSDLDEIKKSQDFLSSKFDALVISVNELKIANSALRDQNAQLRERVDTLEAKIAAAEVDAENLKQYLRRDLLEIHGVPVLEGEDTNGIVKQVTQLLNSDLELNESDISISHRLPANEGSIPSIIVKFTRRDKRDRIYSLKRNLSTKSALDLGFRQESRLFINESLTQKCRELLKEVKSFKRNKHFKFVWTKQGKVFLRKDEDPSSRVYAFSTKEGFEEFKAGFAEQRQEQQGD